MLKKLKDSLAIDMSKIGALEIEESERGDYRLIAYVSGAKITIEWFEAECDAERFLDMLINKIININLVKEALR